MIEWTYVEWIKRQVNFSVSADTETIMSTVDTCLKLMFLGIRPQRLEEDEESMDVGRWLYYNISEAETIINEFVPLTGTETSSSGTKNRIRKMTPEEQRSRTKDIASAQTLLIGLMCKQMIIYAHENFLHENSELVAREAAGFGGTSSSMEDRAHTHMIGHGEDPETGRNVEVAGVNDDSWSEEDDVKSAISAVTDVT